MSDPSQSSSAPTMTLDEVLALYPELERKPTTSTPAADPPTVPAPGPSFTSSAPAAAADTSASGAPTSGAAPAQRATPKVGDMVSYTHEANSGLPRVRRGLVVEVLDDPEAPPRVLVNWLPEGEALLPVDVLDA